MQENSQQPSRGRGLARPRALPLAAVCLVFGSTASLALGGCGGDDRLYADSSPWNEPISDDSPADPRSRVMVDQLVDEVKQNGWPIASGEFTNTIYYADANTPRHDVSMSRFGGRRLTQVPIPEEVRVPPDSDGGVVVIDRSRGCEFDLDEPRREDGDAWAAEAGNAISTEGDGVYPFAEAPSASGFASAGGTILPDELETGRIEHALAFTMKNTKAGGPVAPATGSDGRSTAPGAIPEGARLQLDPRLDLDRLDLKPWEKTIAQALQEYGMYLVDTGGAVALRVQHSLSTSYRYPWGDKPYGQMPTSLAARMRVLTTGPQREPRYRYVQSDCARLR